MKIHVENSAGDRVALDLAYDDFVRLALDIQIYDRTQTAGCFDSCPEGAFIDSNGEKRFLAGGKKAGACFQIKGNGCHYMCEGFATGATIHEATGGTVMVAFDAGNMLLVAAAFRKENPDIQLTI